MKLVPKLCTVIISVLKTTEITFKKFLELVYYTEISKITFKKNETPLFATVFVVLSTLHYYMFRPT
jgi:hypothetical protein